MVARFSQVLSYTEPYFIPMTQNPDFILRTEVQAIHNAAPQLVFHPIQQQCRVPQCDTLISKLIFCVSGQKEHEWRIQCT